MNLPPLPRKDPDQETSAPLSSSEWTPSEIIIRALKRDISSNTPKNFLLLGTLEDEQGRHFIGVEDDRHIFTVASSRSGKGVSLLIPNLLTLTNSVVCLDPKGELAATTALYRAEFMGQKTIVFDPCRIALVSAALRGKFNPLEHLDINNPQLGTDVGAIVDAMLISDGGNDLHWHESARSFIKGIILWMLAVAGENKELRSFKLLYELATLGMADEEGNYSTENLLLNMKAATHLFGGTVAAAAARLLNMGENERGSVLSTACRNLEFLEDAGIQDCMSECTIDLAELKTNPKGVTIYIVLPERYMATHSRFLRLMVSSVLQTMEKTPKALDEQGNALPPTVMILEEFSTLGYMQSIERAIGYIAGFGVRLWTILQDFNQLKKHYRDTWESFISNSGVITAFGNNDVTTTKYLSERLGKCEISRIVPQYSTQEGTSQNQSTVMQMMHSMGDQKGFTPQSKSKSHSQTINYTTQLYSTSLITLDEISKHFARETGVMLVQVAGTNPFRVQRIRAHEDEAFKNKMSPNPYHPAKGA
ncbi:TraM recognition domain-containing protein [bacterium]|nr:TraM recognition domain-containing protein [bacterium]